MIVKCVFSSLGSHIAISLFQVQCFQVQLKSTSPASALSTLTTADNRQHQNKTHRSPKLPSYPPNRKSPFPSPQTSAQTAPCSRLNSRRRSNRLGFIFFISNPALGLTPDLRPASSPTPVTTLRSLCIIFFVFSGTQAALEFSLLKTSDMYLSITHPFA